MARAAIFVAMLALAFPAGAQSVTGTLRVQGTVMISVGGQFVRATNGQPVAAGMQLTVGEGGSATVQFGPDCKRSYESPGTYTIAPARCDNDRKQDDKSRKEDSQQQSEQGQGDAGNAQQQATSGSGSSGSGVTGSGAGAGSSGAAAAAGSTGSLLGELAALGGAVAAGAVAVDKAGGDTTLDEPLSR